MSITNIIKQVYFKTTGYSYPNIGRLFLRLFVGIMLTNFGVRQILHFEELKSVFPAVLGMSSEASLVAMIVVSVGCSLFIMCGFLTRLMVIPPFVAMVISEYELLYDNGLTDPLFSWLAAGYLPAMFLGFYCMLLFVGPGKISIDYFLSLHLLHSENKNEDDLEVV